MLVCSSVVACFVYLCKVKNSLTLTNKESVMGLIKATIKHLILIEFILTTDQHLVLG